MVNLHLTVHLDVHVSMWRQSINGGSSALFIFYMWVAVLCAECSLKWKKKSLSASEWIPKISGTCWQLHAACKTRMDIIGRAHGERLSWPPKNDVWSFQKRTWKSHTIPAYCVVCIVNRNYFVIPAVGCAGLICILQEMVGWSDCCQGDWTTFKMQNFSIQHSYIDSICSVQ